MSALLFAVGCLAALLLSFAGIIFLVNRENDAIQSQDLGDYPAVPDALIEEARADAAKRGAGVPS